MTTHDSVDIAELERRFGPLTAAGAGAWSVAFRGTVDGRDAIVRVGPHADDFRADLDAAQFSSPRLPIPQVLALEPFGAWFCCVSTLAEGEPLEAVSPHQWRSLVSSVADALDEMRTTRPVTTTGPWSAHLLSTDRVDRRLGNWRDALRAWPAHWTVFGSERRRLERLCRHHTVATAAPSLIHGDLLNRNVHVVADTVTGVFDWGSSAWGDHLYDLAWFIFWAPWHRNLDVDLLLDDLTGRWGGEPDPVRLDACLTHIAIDHLAYYASTANRDEADRLCDRIADLRRQ